MGKPVLADTCAWIDFFNARATPLADALEHFLLQGEVYTCGVVTFELVQGVKSPKDKRQLLAALQGVTSIDIRDPLWANAGQLSADLRRAGITIPFSDILIASVALSQGLAVLTVDRHFEQVPGLTVLKSIKK